MVRTDGQVAGAEIPPAYRIQSWARFPATVAYEKLRTSVTRLKQVLNNCRIVVEKWCVLIEPRLLLEPGEPVTSL